MVELIISILAGIGLCWLIHFAIHLIKKMDNNAKTPQNDELFYWYVTYTSSSILGGIFVCTRSEYFRFEDVINSIMVDDYDIEKPIIITNFIKVSKEFFDENKENALTLNLQEYDNTNK